MNRTRAILTAALFSCVLPATAFDWPVQDYSAEAVKSDFGQLRGATINSSIIYKSKTEVSSSDDGKIIAVISEHNDDFGWFESTLGTALIVGHEDGLYTAYGNLNGESIESKNSENEIAKVSAKSVIAESGNSAWQEEQTGLEFKVYDIKNQSAVNPKLLMNRNTKEAALETGAIYLKDKNGTYHNIATEKRLAAGTYYIYRTRQEKAVPFKTIISINGTTEETIVYDTLKADNGVLGIRSSAHYAAGDIYPDKEKQLLAKVQFTKGQNTLTVTLMNIQENAVTVNYRLEIY